MKPDLIIKPLHFYTKTLIILLRQAVTGEKSDAFFGVNKKMHRWRKVSVFLETFGERGTTRK